MMQVEDEIKKKLTGLENTRGTYLVKVCYGSVDVHEVDNNLVADIHGNVSHMGIDAGRAILTGKNN